MGNELQENITPNFLIVEEMNISISSILGQQITTGSEKFPMQANHNIEIFIQ